VNEYIYVKIKKTNYANLFSIANSIYGIIVFAIKENKGKKTNQFNFKKTKNISCQCILSCVAFILCKIWIFSIVL